MELVLDDLVHHVVKYGFDVYPQIEIPLERTHLSIFYEEARERFGALFDQLLASDTEFRISKEFRSSAQPGAGALRVDTFAITNRGPVLTFPICLPEPVGATGIEEQIPEAFDTLRKLFFAALPDRKTMRIGLIRDLLFSTGQAPCTALLSGKPEFAGAKLQRGKSLLVFRDDICNVHLEFEPGELMKRTRLPVGTEIHERHSFVLHVTLDVNNHQLRPLEEADIVQVLERAASIWPQQLLEYFREQR